MFWFSLSIVNDMLACQPKLQIASKYCDESNKTVVIDLTLVVMRLEF